MEDKCDTDQPCNEAEAPMGMCPSRDHRPVSERITLERRVKLHDIAVQIAHMLRGQTRRAERCIIRSMVEVLLESER